MSTKPYRIDNLQYANWSEGIFRQMRAAGLDAVHATLVYHEDFRAMVRRLTSWQALFRDFHTLIMPGRSVEDIEAARASDRTAIFFGFQNPSPIENDIGLVALCHDLGCRFMQLSYNNQSLLASGCAEDVDGGITRMGHEVIAEMNRVGMVVDMSHAGERSTLEAIDISRRPVAVTHANPASWHAVPRNVSEDVLRALANNGGMLGFSLYPHHMVPQCTLEAFCTMVARTAERIGVATLGIGSDLCQGQPDSVVMWMRYGHWTQHRPPAAFPPMPSWFQDSCGFHHLESGLEAVGFNPDERAAILGENWYRFYAQSFQPHPTPHPSPRP